MKIMMILKMMWVNMSNKIQELYLEYREYRNDGLTHKEALDEFKYLPEQTLNNLIRFIEETQIDGNIKE